MSIAGAPLTLSELGWIEEDLVRERVLVLLLSVLTKMRLPIAVMRWVICPSFLIMMTRFKAYFNASRCERWYTCASWATLSIRPTLLINFTGKTCPHVWQTYHIVGMIRLKCKFRVSWLGSTVKHIQSWSRPVAHRPIDTQTVLDLVAWRRAIPLRIPASINADIGKQIILLS